MSTQFYKNKESIADIHLLPDKMVVFQECMHQFNASHNSGGFAKKSRFLLAQLVRLIYHGEVFPALESTSLFFSISKLFQHKDQSLRQMVYLAVKELAATSHDILMVTASIMKDIQSGNTVYKSNAIRTLAKVLDLTTVQSVERLFKGAIVDKNPIIASAALTSSYGLLKESKDVIKHFANEVSEDLQPNKVFPPGQFSLHENYGHNTASLPPTSFMYQYHALGLLYQLRSHDKMALVKLITTLGERNGLKNSLLLVELIRFKYKLLVEDESLKDRLLPLIVPFINHLSDMVQLETCKTLVALQRLLSSTLFADVVNSLNKLMASPRVATRFAAIRLINKISTKNPEAALSAKFILQTLVKDPNRTISTLAVTTLLKVMGNGNIQPEYVGNDIVKLMETLTGMMLSIDPDFKVLIIEAIENLALKFPKKQDQLVEFLVEEMRGNDELSIQSAILDALFGMIKFSAESTLKQSVLMSLCEVIEDCEFPEISVRVLHLLGEEGPKTTNPCFYIRHIYNRLVLENSIVRSSAVLSLSRFACVCGGEIAANVKVVLSRCLKDVDDEVRDRAALSLKFIATNHHELIVSNSRYDLAILESKLTQYLRDGKFDNRFEISLVPLVTDEELRSHEYARKIRKLESGLLTETAGIELLTDANAMRDSADLKSDVNDHASEALRQQTFAHELAAIPELAKYGNLTQSSSKAIYLTEKENEFVVASVMHFFIDAQKLVLQYDITNTLTRSTLQDISVIVQPDNELYEEDFIIPLAELKPNETGTVYVSLSTPSIQQELLAAFGNTVSFTNKDIIDTEGNVDPSEDGWSDEYQIDDLFISAGNFVNPLYSSNFKTQFDLLPEGETTVRSLEAKSIEDAALKLIEELNLMPLDGSDTVSSNATSHVLNLFGKDIWGGKVCVMARLAKSNDKLVAKIEARCETEQLVPMILALVI